METSKYNTQITKMLSEYPKLKVFDSEQDIHIGLLRYNNVPHAAAFIFRFKDEKVRSFHTVGMRFNIDICFFNKKGELVKKYINCKPGLENISSVHPSKYVVEIKSHNRSGE